MMSSISSSSSAAGIFLSEKDLESTEFNVVVTPCEFSDESQVLSSEDEHEPIILEAVRQSYDHQQQSKAAAYKSCLETKTPPHFEEFDKEVVVLDDDKDGDEGDGFITPTSLQERTPVSLPACPPAPRKPKSLPLKKRKAHETQIILTDDSEEIQSFFALAVFTDLGGGGKAKKLRSDNFL